MGYVGNMAKDKNGKDLEVGDEVVLVLRIEEIVPKGGDVAVLRAVGVHGASAKYPERYEVVLYPDQVILQRSGRSIKPKGCGVRGCGLPMPHEHPPLVPTPEGETCHDPDCGYGGHVDCRGTGRDPTAIRSG